MIAHRICDFQGLRALDPFIARALPLHPALFLKKEGQKLSSKFF